MERRLFGKFYPDSSIKERLGIVVENGQTEKRTNGQTDK